MSQTVTDKDLARFAALGYPAPVQPADDVDVAALADSLCRAMESPSARLLDAALLALQWLADHDALERLTQQDLSPEASRRLGFLADKLANTNNPPAQRRLQTLADGLYHHLAQQPDGPLTFTAATTDTYLQQLQQRADDTNHKWQVFADVDASPSPTELS